jgi:hypothetical protein
MEKRGPLRKPNKRRRRNKRSLISSQEFERMVICGGVAVVARFAAWMRRMGDGLRNERTS